MFFPDLIIINPPFHSPFFSMCENQITIFCFAGQSRTVRRQPDKILYIMDGIHISSMHRSIFLVSCACLLACASLYMIVDLVLHNHTDCRPNFLSFYFLPQQENNGNTAGCYDLTCQGFIQTSGLIPLGAPFSNVSQVGGVQYDADLLISQV